MPACIRFLAVFAFLTGLPAVVHAQANHDPARADTAMFSPGENLVYEVSYMNVALGQVRLKTFDSYSDRDGRVQHPAAAIVDSYEGVPFVNLHEIDTTQMNKGFFSVGFRATEKKEDHWAVERLHYHFPNRKVIIEQSTVGEPTASLTDLQDQKYDTLSIPDTLVEDGLSILYYARANVMRRDTVAVPTIVHGKLGRTVFHFTKKKSDEEIDAIEGKKVRTIAFEGKAEFQGIFGLTGDFKGWFSDDDAAVPIKAEMKVLIGSVKLELIKWKRPGWSPPLAD